MQFCSRCKQEKAKARVWRAVPHANAVKMRTVRLASMTENVCCGPDSPVVTR